MFIDRKRVESGGKGALVDRVLVTDAAVERGVEGCELGLKSQGNLWIRMCVALSGFHLIINFCTKKYKNLHPIN